MSGVKSERQWNARQAHAERNPGKPEYPEAVFTPDHVDGPLGQPEVGVHGKINIHGADHELTLHVKVVAEGGQYMVSTHFTIPYVQWGMKNRVISC